MVISNVKWVAQFVSNRLQHAKPPVGSFKGLQVQLGFILFPWSDDINLFFLKEIVVNK